MSGQFANSWGWKVSLAFLSRGMPGIGSFAKQGLAFDYVAASNAIFMAKRHRRFLLPLLLGPGLPSWQPKHWRGFVNEQHCSCQLTDQRAEITTRIWSNESLQYQLDYNAGVIQDLPVPHTGLWEKKPGTSKPGCRVSVKRLWSPRAFRL